MFYQKAQHLGWILFLCLAGSIQFAHAQTISLASSSGAVCPNTPLTYEVTPASSTAQYTWVVTGGNAASSTGSQNTITWTEQGAGEITVIIVDNGNATSISLTESIPAPIDAEIISDPPLSCTIFDGREVPDEKGRTYIVCEGNVLTLTAEPAGLPNGNYNWSSSGNVSLSGSGGQVTATFGTAGPAEVSLTVTDGDCSASTTLAIEVQPHPIAEFTGNGVPDNGLVTICEGQTVFFNSTSYTPGVDANLDHLWTFPGGSTSTLTNPSFTFDQAGVYTVQLEVSRCGLCHDLAKITVRVENAPAPQIECLSWVCAGNSGTYTSPDFCPGAFWTVTGGTFINCASGSGNTCSDPVIEVQWGNTGPFTLELDVSACGGTACPVPGYYEVPVINDAEINGPVLVNAGNNGNYSVEPIPNGSYDWTVTFDNGIVLNNFPDNSAISVSTANVGNATGFTVSVTYSSSLFDCEGTASLNVELCNTSFVQCKDDNGNSISCYGFLCEGDNRIFEVSIPPSQGTVDWEILESGNSIATIPGTSGSLNYTFANEGLYEVRPTYTNPDGLCGQPGSINFLNVLNKPVPVIEGPTEIPCAQFPYGYWYSVPALATHTVNWSLSANGFILQNEGNAIQVSWNGPGPHSLTAQYDAISSFGCDSDPVSINVSIVSGGGLIEGEDEACLESTESYSYSIPDAEQYVWEIIPSNLGSIVDGQGTSTITIDWHGSTVAPVTATVRLTTQACGNSLIINYPVTLDYPPQPLVSASPAEICPDGTVTFTVNPNNNAPALSYTWNFGDGTAPVTTSNPSYTYTYNLADDTDKNIGISVTVQYQNAVCSNTGTGSTSIKVYPKPLALLTHTPNIFCIGDPISTTLYATVENYPGSSQTYNYFRNGVLIASTSNPYLTVNQVGDYWVEVVRDYGNVSCSQISDIVRVDTEPCSPPQCTCAINISQSQGAKCNQFRFDARVCRGGQILGWLVSDGTAYGPVSNITHTFDHAGLYYVTVRVNKHGCIVEETLPVEVYLVPHFSHEILCSASNTRVLRLYDRSEWFHPNPPVSNYAPNSWTWSDANGVIATGPDVLVTLPPGPATWGITLTVSSPQATCTLSQKIKVPAEPVADFSTAGTICAGTPVDFLNTSTGEYLAGSTFWNFGDGAFTGIQNPSRTYASGGTYTATLSIADEFGCTYQHSQTLQVNDPQPGPFMITETVGTPTCTDPAITLGTNFTTPPPAQFIWSTGEVSPTIIPEDPGVYDVTILDGNGCVYELPNHVVAFSTLPTPDILSQNGDGFCEGVQNDFTSSVVQPGLSYSWDIDDIYPDPLDPNRPPTTNKDLELPNDVAPGTYTIYLTISQNGCSATASYTFTIHPKPEAQIAMAGSLCSPIDLQLTGSNAPGNTAIITEYLWTPSNITGQTLTVNQGGFYRVQLTSDQGCVGSESVRIADEFEFNGLLTGCYDLCKEDIQAGISISWNPPNNGGTFFGCSYTYVYGWFEETPNGPVQINSSSTITLMSEGTFFLKVSLVPTGDCSNLSGCTYTSEPIIINEVECSECRLSLDGPPTATCIVAFPNNAGVLYDVDIPINNGGSPLTNVQITLPPIGQGDVIQSQPSTTIPAGQSTFSFEFIDLPPSNAGSNYCFNISGVDAVSGDKCEIDVCILLRPNCPTPGNCGPILQGTPGRVDCDEKASANSPNPIYNLTFNTSGGISFLNTPVYVFGTGVNILSQNPYTFNPSATTVTVEHLPPYNNPVTITLLFNNGHGYCVRQFTTILNPCRAGGGGARNGMESTGEHQVQYFPNPAHTQLNVAFPPLEEATTVSLYDMQGKRLQTFQVEAGKTRFSIGTTSLPAGVYMIETHRPGMPVSREKIVIRH